VVYISTEAGSGSGFIFDPTGYILTNAHVVKGFSSVEVTLNNKRNMMAHVVGINNLNNDVAVLKMDGGNNFQFIKLGNSDNISQGDEVFALGFPLGIQEDVSFKEGTVSRRIKNEKVPYLEISAEVYHGNSGGPLVNRSGEVIGIITTLSGYGEGSEGVGGDVKWAIEFNYIKSELSDLKVGMQLLKNKSRTETESIIRLNLNTLSSQLSDSIGISRAISNSYNATSFQYHERQIIDGVNTANESQESLRKGYLQFIVGGYKILLDGLEVLNKSLDMFTNFYSENSSTINTLSNNFERQKIVDFNNYVILKRREYDKKIGETHSKINSIQSVIEKGGLKNLQTSYILDLGSSFKSDVSFISTEKESLTEKLWIKLLF